MHFWDKVNLWFTKNKKSILIGSSVVLILIGSGVGYVLYKNNNISFADWLKLASKEELDEAYKKLQQFFNKTGKRPFEMQQIDHELSLRGAKEWAEKHPPNLDPLNRWTDKERWE